MNMAMMIEFEYSTGDGHTWMIRCPRSHLKGAVDAVFQWFATLDRFTAEHLGAFLSVILQDAINQKTITSETYTLVTRIMHEIPKTGIVYSEKVNLMRRIMHAALDSTP